MKEKEPNVGIFYDVQELERADSMGVHPMGAIILNSYSVIEPEVFREYMNSLEPQNLTKKDKEKWDDHLQALMDAYEQYSRSINYFTKYYHGWID